MRCLPSELRFASDKICQSYCDLFKNDDYRYLQIDFRVEKVIIREDQKILKLLS